MKQTDCLSTETNEFIDEFLRQHDVTLFGFEVDERDFDETPHGSNPDDIRYNATYFNRTTFKAEGFVWQHPNGGTVSGMFAQPITAQVVEISDEGEELSCDDFEGELCAAIVAKCGRISGFADSCLA